LSKQPTEVFRDECAAEIEHMTSDAELRQRSLAWMVASAKYKYTYHFTWMGRPVIQFPQDLVAIQEVVWRVNPEVIIETGVAHGGSLVFYASLLELLGGPGVVIGVEIDLREHNRDALEAHPMAKRIAVVQGSSTDQVVVDEVRRLAAGRKGVLVVLDSNHEHGHVLRELELYSPLVTPGSYLIVCDTIIEDMPPDAFPDRPWGVGNNPRTAVEEFLRHNSDFEVDTRLESKLLITVSPGGYLRCIRK
jgi:cephalosporin hydroxylase